METGGVLNIFDCAVCLSQMLHKTPRSLTCLHTFCEECLIPLIKNKQIVCPSCRQPTQIKEGDVRKLPVNFLLIQMKDFAFSKESISTEKCNSRILCEVCKNNAVKYKCADCPKKMCAVCKRRHSTIRKNKDHYVHDFCIKHNDIVQKLCMTCETPLCKFCETEHVAHVQVFVDYDKMLKEFENGVDKLKQSIMTAENEYDDNFDNVTKKKKIHCEVLEELKERRKCHNENIKEAERLIRLTEDSLELYKQLELEFEKTRFESEELKYRIEILDEDSLRIRNLPALKQQVEDNVKQLKINLDEKYGDPIFVLCKQGSRKLAFYKQQQDLQKLKLLHTLSCRSTEDMDYNKQLASIGEDILAITDETCGHVIKMNQQGEVLAHYYPEEEENVIGINACNNKIYIVQERSINVVEFKEKQSMTKVYKPDIETMVTIFVIDDQNFLISECKIPGNVYWFNTVKNTTKPVAKRLNNPTYMNHVYTQDGPRYIITETISHCVTVYTETWDLLYTIGTRGTGGSTDGKLLCPRGTAVTEQNTILIADWGNHRICHFTLDGKFLSHVITEEDIEFPIGLLYDDNKLWVSRLRDGQIKCFQLQYTK